MCLDGECNLELVRTRRERNAATNDLSYTLASDRSQCVSMTLPVVIMNRAARSNDGHSGAEMFKRVYFRRERLVLVYKPLRNPFRKSYLQNMCNRLTQGKP